MNSSRTFFLLLIALLVFCFSMAANLQPRFQSFQNARHQSDNFFSLLLGDSSRIFANSAFIEADAYYHSGYYPTIYDNKSAFQTPHIAEDTGAVASHNQGEETSFMGPPRDWVDAFGRHFIPNRHTHLDEGGPTDDLSKSHEVQEILPWLKLSAELDPEDIRTYVVTAFWLTRLNQIGAAEQVLREGLRHNPDNAQLLFELGRIYFENYHNPSQARNIWEAALRSWARQQPASRNPNGSKTPSKISTAGFFSSRSRPASRNSNKIPAILTRPSCAGNRPSSPRPTPFRFKSTLTNSGKNRRTDESSNP